MTVYLDHNASTPLLPEVKEAMLPFLGSYPGNASSLHKSGRFLRSAIENARQQVAELVNAEPGQVVFTSGGSEANNLAIKGMIEPTASCTILTSHIEHASVLQPVAQMKQNGCSVGYIDADQDGAVVLADAWRKLEELQPDLLSLQLANNETGVIQPLRKISSMAHQQGSTMVHTDATQAIGKIDVDMQALQVDLLTLSGHKFNGPQGTGALVSTAPVRQPLISGGYQESGNRAGTENVALIVGLGKAAEIARTKLREKQAYLLELRRYFEQQLKGIPGVIIFGERVERLPNTSFFSIPYYHGETLLMQLDKAGFELASGSACHSEVTRPSHVLSAMGVDETLALNAVRVSLGMDNTRKQIDALIATMNDLINSLPAVVRQAAS
jgi:cysteine desulfurase